MTRKKQQKGGYSVELGKKLAELSKLIFKMKREQQTGFGVLPPNTHYGIRPVRIDLKPITKL
jgi:hypothetical protein